MAAVSKGKVTASLTAQNTGTDALEMSDRFYNVSVSGTWSATLFLQRSFDGGATWLDVWSRTTNVELAAQEETERGVVYRLFIKTSGFSSGTAVLRLSQ
jgi:hypothetical protein